MLTRDELVPQIQHKLDELAELFGATAVELLDEVVELTTRVQDYPSKSVSLILIRTPGQWCTTRN